jgi:hypothetical protein
MWKRVVNATPQPLYSREKYPVSIVQEAGWAPGPVWTGADNLASSGIRSSVRPARSESLYRLIVRNFLLTKYGRLVFFRQEGNKFHFIGSWSVGTGPESPVSFTSYRNACNKQYCTVLYDELRSRLCCIVRAQLRAGVSRLDTPVILWH